MSANQLASMLTAWCSFRGITNVALWVSVYHCALSFWTDLSVENIKYLVQRYFEPASSVFSFIISMLRFEGLSLNVEWFKAKVDFQASWSRSASESACGLDDGSRMYGLSSR